MAKNTKKLVQLIVDQAEEALIGANMLLKLEEQNRDTQALSVMLIDLLTRITDNGRLATKITRESLAR